jgi:hypothetical protein
VLIGGHGTGEVGGGSSAGDEESGVVFELFEDLLGFLVVVFELGVVGEHHVVD